MRPLPNLLHRVPPRPRAGRDPTTSCSSSSTRSASSGRESFPGYYTAYKGKWHLTKEFETVNKLGKPTKIFTDEMEAYGFSDYVGIGDIIAHTHGGYLHDGIIAAMGVSWLRGKGRELSAEGKPWFLAVKLINPHDVMYYNTDAPGTVVQAKDNISHVAREPVDPLYAKQWARGEWAAFP